MGFVFFGFGHDVSFAQFHFNDLLQVKADVHGNVGPVFVLAESLAFGMAVALFRTEELDLLVGFRIIVGSFSGRSEQVSDDVHN